MADKETHSKTIARVAIIGCGNIGSRLDEDQADNGSSLTHAKAFHKLIGQAEIVALSDPDEGRLNFAGQRWGVDSLYSDYKHLLDNEEIDILSICTPSSLRVPVFESACENNVKVIFCEKPLAITLKEANQIKKLIEEKNIPVIVNYSRRWDTGFQKIKKILEIGSLGNLQSVTAIYGKGILNNGSHLLDLMNFYFDKYCSIEVIGKINDEYKSYDPTLSCIIQYEFQGNKFPFYMIPTDHRNYTVFEIDFIGEKGRIRVLNNGLSGEIYYKESDPLFNGYHRLRLNESIKNLGMTSFDNAACQVVEIFQNPEIKPSCGIDDAISVLSLCENLKLKFINNLILK